MSEFGKVLERTKFIVNIGESEVLRCSSYGNGCRLHVRLDGEPLEGVDCFEVFELWKWVSIACETRWRVVRRSGLF